MADPACESIDKEVSDHAGVAFPPPVLLGVFLLTGFGLRAVIPLAFLPENIVFGIGPLLVVLSFLLFLWAARSMHLHGASIPTGDPTDVIVCRGPYRFSRNPIYLAMVALLLGVGIWGNSLWFICLAILAVVLLTWGVITREETYLERKFGSEYSIYKSDVRRWL